MKILKELFENMSYIDGITIINLEGEILFTAKFNNKLHNSVDNFEVVGKKFQDIYSNLDSNNSTMLQSITLERPVFIENQKLIIENDNSLLISSLSLPIKYHGRIVGAIDLSIEKQELSEIKKYDEISPKSFSDHTINALNSPQCYIKYTLQDIITDNIEMIRIKKFIKEICNSDLPVIIYGETGTGKELVAHSLHSEGIRKSKPFIAQNCSAIPEHLFESIFFGTVKGAYTDSKNTAGLFELANGGTLFLDELNSMPLYLQSKLLRVIEDKKFCKLGSKEIISVNVRLVVALNKDPLDSVRDGELRSDLYFRISALKVNILPLRKRKEDISTLTKFFISKYNHIFQKNIKKISYKVYKKLESYHWPGNIRELENVILFGVCMVPKEKEILELSDIHITVGDTMSTENESSQSEVSLKKMIQDYESSIIQSSLQKNNYNVSKTAADLKIPRQTLHRKIKFYNL